jgi:hypothetical protein
MIASVLERILLCLCALPPTGARTIRTQSSASTKPTFPCREGEGDGVARPDGVDGASEGVDVKRDADEDVDGASGSNNVPVTDPSGASIDGVGGDGEGDDERATMAGLSLCALPFPR